MKPWQEHIDLAPLTTFGVPARCHAFVDAARFDEAIDALREARQRDLPTLVLGGGSNILFTRDFAGLVVRMNQRGITREDQGERILITAAAGEPWHAFVLATLAQGAYGLENLALIPGTVGAAPVQNIGAYGVEIKDVLDAVQVWDRENDRCEWLAAADCRFAYRDSLFKQQPGRHLILQVRFALSAHPRLHTNYAELTRELQGRGISTPRPADVCDAVIAVRSRKLPDPAVLGNAGSFFKNPIVSGAQAAALLQAHPDAPHWPMAQGQVKFAAGWLIERCGWKGRAQGAAAVYEKQALVLVNRGGASGQDIVQLADAVRASVRQSFGIELEAEPLIL